MFGTPNYIAEVNAQSRIADYQKFSEQQRLARFAKREVEQKKDLAKSNGVARPSRKLLGIFG